MSSHHRHIRAALFAASAIGSLASAQAAFAQQDAAPQTSAAAPQDEVADIVVTGIRGSLQSATNAKKNAVAFGDSIFAEDIGKLPATNLAETLNRMPGVRLNRDINGEGTQVAIRGLGPSFTRVLLNGSQLQVASDGGTNGVGDGWTACPRALLSPLVDSLSGGRRGCGRRGSRSEDASRRYRVRNDEQGDKRFLCIDVMPHFL